MSIAILANLLTIILCLAVLVQSVRMMRSLKGVNVVQMGTVVLGLDHASTQARHVLDDLKRTLREEGTDNAQLLREGLEMRDELRMMIEIGDNMAQRLADAPRAQTPHAQNVRPIEGDIDDLWIEEGQPTANASPPDRDMAQLRALVADYGLTRNAIDRATHHGDVNGTTFSAESQAVHGEDSDSGILRGNLQQREAA
jgi:hypothetical protein